jgi:uncharacterized protein YkwD
MTVAVTPSSGATANPAPVVRVQSDRNVRPLDPVNVAVYRVSGSKPVTVVWGDGARTRITGRCSAAVAARHPFKCSAKVSHAYRSTGVFKIVVSRAPYSAYRAVLRVAGTKAPANAPAAAAAPPTATSSAAAWQEQMLSRVNALRSAAGAAPVALCTRLLSSAQDYASLMANSNYYGHVGPDGSEPWDRMSAHGYQWRGAAENIAAGFSDLDEVMKAWQSSPGHYANIVNPEFEHVGFGMATQDSSTYGTYWVQHFGRGGTCS